MPALRMSARCPARRNGRPKRDLPRCASSGPTSLALDVLERRRLLEQRAALPHRPGATARQAHPRPGCGTSRGIERIGDRASSTSPTSREVSDQSFDSIICSHVSTRRPPIAARFARSPSAGRRGMGDSPGAHQLRTRGNARGPLDRRPARTTSTLRAGRPRPALRPRLRPSPRGGRVLGHEGRLRVASRTRRRRPLSDATRAKPSTSAALVRADVVAGSPKC